MNKKTGRWPTRLIALALLFSPGMAPLPAYAANDITALASAQAQAIDAAIASHLLFAMLIEDQPTFRSEWEKRLRLHAITRPDANTDANGASQAGLGLAMDAAKPYLTRASDDAANHFLAVLGRVIALGQNDAALCLAFVETGGSAAKDVEYNQTMQSPLDDTLMDDMLQSLANVVASGRNGEARVLSLVELPQAIQPVIVQLAQTHGADSLRGLALVNDRGASPLERCQAMAHMLDAVAAQPQARRAMLARTLFSDTLPQAR